MGTHVVVPFRILTGIFVLVLGPTASITSTSTISLSTRTTEPAHRRIGCRSILRSRDHILALIAEYLERFVEDRSQLGEDRERSGSYECHDLRDARPLALECSFGSFPNRCPPSVATAFPRASEALRSDSAPGSLARAGLPRQMLDITIHSEE